MPVGRANRRGPARGYVEALEHRLQMTEGVLLRLLSQVSDPDLSNIFPGDSLLGDRTGYAPLARLEKKGVEEWSQFPLDSVQSVRKWQRVCTSQGSDRPDSQSVESECSSTEVHGGVKRNTKDTHEQEQSSSPTSSVKAAGQQPLSGPGNRAAFAEIGSDTPDHMDHRVSGSDYAQDVNAMQTRSSWDGAPSISFQQQFLW
ncbi:hypothetical protein N7448_003088 [Penicillium atrosanguineum]|nr:hypothetical protein N7448_003088 [Penicillium atrosanguineum]